MIVPDHILHLPPPFRAALVNYWPSQPSKNLQTALTGFVTAMDSLRKEAAAGCAAGVIGTVLGFPLDTLKSHMQFHQSPSMVATARTIYSEGGVLALYRGISAPLFSLVLLNTLNFSTYATFRAQFGLKKDDDVRGLGDTARCAAAAACVGPLSAVISTPFELVKTQMQLNLKSSEHTASSSSSSGSIGSGATPTANPPPTRSSAVHAMNLVRMHGPRVLYYGYFVNTVREIVFLSTYFTVYENVKSVLMRLTTVPSVAIPVAGGLSGAAGWLVSFPLEAIKVKIQGMKYATPSDRPPSAVAVAREVLASKGLRGLYTGVTPSIARAFLVSASRFSAYELTLSLLE